MEESGLGSQLNLGGGPCCHQCQENLILNVKFGWIRYVTDWRRSGPGYFAGIAVTKKGQWEANVTLTHTLITIIHHVLCKITVIEN